MRNLNCENPPRNALAYAVAGLAMSVMLAVGCRSTSEAKNPRWSAPLRNGRPVSHAFVSQRLAQAAEQQDRAPIASRDLSPFEGKLAARTERSISNDSDPALRTNDPPVARTSTSSGVAMVSGREATSADEKPPVARIAIAPPPAPWSGDDATQYVHGTPVLTLDEAEALALSTNPLISELQSRIDGLCGKKLQATLPPNPTVGVTGSDIFEDGTGGRHGVYFGREIVRGNKLGLSASTVDAEIQVAQQQLQAAQQRLRTDVRLAWFDLLVANRKQTLAQQLTEIARQAVDTSQRLFEAQEVARTAVLQAEMEFQNANVVVGQVAAERTAAERRLATLIGKTSLDNAPLEGDPETAVDQADFEMAFDEILSSSPELAALQMDIERARRNIARQCAEPIPNVTWQATVLYDTVSDNIVTGYQVGLPLPVRNRNQGAVQQARREMEAAAYRAERRALALRQDLATAFEAFTRAKIEADITRDQILPKARQTWDLVVEGYAQGEVDFLNLLTAQRTYFDANLNYLNALRQVWREGNRIRGFLLDDGLNTPSP